MAACILVYPINDRMFNRVINDIILVCIYSDWRVRLWIVVVQSLVWSSAKASVVSLAMTVHRHCFVRLLFVRTYTKGIISGSLLLSNKLPY